MVANMRPRKKKKKVADMELDTEVNKVADNKENCKLYEFILIF